MQIGKWRKSAVEQLPELFADGRTRKGPVIETGNHALYEEIGRAEGRVGLAYKSWHARLRICGCWWIGVAEISIRRQCELLGVNRSCLYYAER